jgi:hypothetical protein
MPAVTYGSRAKETSTTTGTGTLTLAGAMTGYQTLVAAAGDGAYVPYTAVGTSGAAEGEWETGYGTVTDAASDTLSRTVVEDSSNSGSLVNFSAGTKEVFLTAHAAVLEDVNRAMDVIGTYDPSAVSELDIDVSGYEAVRIVGYLEAATDNDGLFLRFSNDGGSTFRQGASDYMWASYYASTGAAGKEADDADSEIELAGSGVGNAAGEQVAFTLDIVAPAESGAKTAATMLIHHHGTTGIGFGKWVTGRCNTAEVNDAIRLLFSSGNIDAGHVVAYGYKNAATAAASHVQVVAVQTQTPSAASEVDFDISGYESVKLVGWLQPATDAVTLFTRFSNDGGSTFRSAVTDYDSVLHYGYTHDDTTAVIGDTGLTGILQGTNIGNASGEGVEFTLQITNAGDADWYTSILGHVGEVDLDGNKLYAHVGGRVRSAREANDAVRLVFSSGNIADGRVTMYGYPAA